MDKGLLDILQELVALADEKDVTLLLPNIAIRLRELSDKRNWERSFRNGVYHPVANSVPPSPTTHSGDQGAYNSPRSSNEPSPIWSDIAVGA